MGIVKLIENKNDGRYAVEIIKDVERAKAVKEKLKTDIEKLKLDIKEKTDLLPAAEQKVTDKGIEYNAEILVLQDREVIIDQLKIELSDKEDLLVALQLQINLKDQEKADIEAALNAPGLTQEEIDALQAQLAIVNAQINDLTDQLNQATQETSDISARVNELSDPKNQFKKVNELTKAFFEVAKERDAIKIEITYLEIQKAAKEKRLNDYDELIEDIDARDIWCVDYEVTLEPTPEIENPLVSIEINDDPTHILLAPRTYTPTPEDAQQILLAGLAKQAEYEELTDQLQINEDALAESNLKVEAKRQEVFDERAFITTIPPETSAAERKRLILESNERLKKLEQEFFDIVGDTAAIAEKSNALDAKRTLVGKVVSQLDNEHSKLVTAISSPSGIYVPIIDEYTKQIQPTQSSGPTAVFYNKALLPGYQKWLPTFRTGTITAIENDICDVSLDKAVSSQQKLNINQHETLTDVPIKYGNCNGAVFVVGDNIVVEFKGRDQTKPVVIGFEDHPRACGGIVCIPSSDSAPNGWGYPLKTEGGVDINPPLGTVGGTRPQYIFNFSAPPESTPRISRNIETALGGNCHSNGSPFVSWHGPFGFNIAPDIKVGNVDIPGYETQVIEIAGNDFSVYSRFTANIYQNKKLRATAPGDVLGAGFYGNTLVCVIAVTRLRDAIYYQTHDDAWHLVGNIDYLDALNTLVLPRFHCYWFSSDGTKITSLVASIENTSAVGWIEYANIPDIVLNKDTDGAVLLASLSISNYFNMFELSEIIDSTRSGSIDPPYPINYSTNYESNTNISGNNEIILGVGFAGNDLKKIIGRFSYTANAESSSTFHLDDDNKLNASGSGSGFITLTASYYRDTDLLFQTSSSESSTLSVAYDNINNNVTHSNLETVSNEFNYIYLLYFNVNADYYLYKKISRTIDSTDENSSDTDTWTYTYSITALYEIYSSNNLLPVTILDHPLSGVNTNTQFPGLRIPSRNTENVTNDITAKFTEYFGKPDDPFCGALDQYKNGIFQYRALSIELITGQKDIAILPKTYTVNSLTGAIGANPRLADLDTLFQPDTVVTDGIIFRI
jgi:hypothetical protein